MKTTFKILLILSLILATRVGISSSLEVRFHQHTRDLNNPVRQYYSKLLKVALDETKQEYGDYNLVPRMFASSQQRSLMVLKDEDYIDVHWTMTSALREKQLTAIYFPLLKGLMGYRVLLIKKKAIDTISNIKTLADLKNITLGQGIGWPDSIILKANKLNVSLANSENLHEMLVKERFDAFPRAVTEAWRELSFNDSLTVDCCLLLQYISPVYFFVKKENTVLAERLTKGLQLALDNGKFDELFFKYRAPKKMFDLVDFDNRNRIYLQNPTLSSKTKELLQQSNLWF